MHMKNSEKDLLAGEIERLKARIKALELNQQRFRATLYSIGDGMIATDAEGCIVEITQHRLVSRLGHGQIVVGAMPEIIFLLVTGDAMLTADKIRRLFSEQAEGH